MGEKLVEVYRASGELEAQVIKCLLEGYGIPCVLRSNAAPSVHVFSPGVMGEVMVSVLESRADEAQEIISGQ